MRNHLSLLALLLMTTFWAAPASAVKSERECLSCRAIQHAVNLATIEKHLRQSNPQIITELNDEARSWFTKFQEGGLFFDGWKDITVNILENVPADRKIPTKFNMLALGVRIGCEWSKENDIRKISTKMLKEWGEKLREAVAQYPEKIPHVIWSIESEVDVLLVADE